MSPLLAQSGHPTDAWQCPLLGVNQTSAAANLMSAFDPKRTLTRRVALPLIANGSGAMKKTIFAALGLIWTVVSADAQQFSPDEIARRTIERRAVEAMIWGMPGVNTDLMYEAMVHETKGAWNQIVYWSRLSDWKNQTLTPNPDAIYLMAFLQHEGRRPNCA
jgi:hypothetical protein